MVLLLRLPASRMIHSDTVPLPHGGARIAACQCVSKGNVRPLIDDAFVTPSDDLPNFFDNRWLAWRTRRAMHRGVRRVVKELQPQGVIRAIPFLGFHVEPVVWLVTRLDAERDSVTRHGIPRDLVIQHLEEAGVRSDLAARAGSHRRVRGDGRPRPWGNWRVAMQ